MSSLYALTTELLAMMDDDNVDDEALQAAFGDITKKSESVCKYLAVLSSQMEVFKAEEQRISARRKAMENHHARIKEFIKGNMERLGIDRLDAGTFTISLQNNPASVVIDNDEAIPAAYKTVVQKFIINKTSLKEVLGKGTEIPGAHLEINKHIRIK